MTRLPKPGDRVRWGTPQGDTEGTVEAIVTSPTQIKGHTAEASHEHPEVLVRSAKSGKTAVHKPGALRHG
jgi:hypothetical protein